ncbi:MAG: hypothetical protein GY816_11635 [Cytophagales bacterium]|nr:hypothetical protein [Cytophagales bacterium]
MRIIHLGRCVVTNSGLVNFTLNWLKKTDQQTTTIEIPWKSENEVRAFEVALNFAGIEYYDDDDLSFHLKRNKEDNSPKLHIHRKTTFLELPI